MFLNVRKIKKKLLKKRIGFYWKIDLIELRIRTELWDTLYYPIMFLNYVSMKNDKITAATSMTLRKNKICLVICEYWIPCLSNLFKVWLLLYLCKLNHNKLYYLDIDCVVKIRILLGHIQSLHSLNIKHHWLCCKDTHSPRTHPVTPFPEHKT